MNRKTKIAIVNTDSDSSTAICRAAGITANDAAGQTLDDPQSVVQFLSTNAPTVVFFGIDQNSSAALEAIRTFSEASAANNSRSAVIGIANRASSDLLLEAVRAGVEEFLTPPLDDKAICEAVRNICRKKGILQSDSTSGEGKIITFFSGKGGCGKTLLAVNIACELMNCDAESSVVLLDLSLQFGNAATLLDMQPRHTIVDCIDDAGAVDEELLTRLPARHHSGVAVIPGPEDPADSEHITPEHIQQLLAALRKRYTHVIVDTSNAFDEINLAALDMSDRIMLVTDTLVPSVRNTQRCLKVFGKLGYDIEKITLLVNRFDKRVGSGQKELQQAFDVPVAAFLPNEFNTVMNAVDAGVALSELDAKSEVYAGIRKIVSEMAGTVAVAGETRWFSKLTELIGR